MTYTIDQLATMFQRDAVAMRRLLPKLLAAGFPPRLPGCQLYSQPAVDAWFENWPGVMGKGVDIEPDYLVNAVASLNTPGAK